jgi:large-conductance mechanosensitive channel
MATSGTVNIINSSSAITSVNKIVDTAESTIKHFDETLTNSITIVVTFFVTQTKKFLKFLIDKNVVSAGLAIIVGTQIGKLTGAFVEYLLAPFINMILAGETKSLDDYVIVIYGVNFKIGLFITNLIQFLINMLMVYYVFQIAQLSTSGFDSILNQSVTTNALAASR